MSDQSIQIQDLIKRIINTKETFQKHNLRGVAGKGDLRNPTQVIETTYDPLTGTIGNDEGGGFAGD